MMDTPTTPSTAPSFALGDKVRVSSKSKVWADWQFDELIIMGMLINRETGEVEYTVRVDGEPYDFGFTDGWKESDLTPLSAQSSGSGSVASGDEFVSVPRGKVLKACRIGKKLAYDPRVFEQLEKIVEQSSGTDIAKAVAGYEAEIERLKKAEIAACIRCGELLETNRKLRKEIHAAKKVGVQE